MDSLGKLIIDSVEEECTKRDFARNDAHVAYQVACAQAEEARRILMLIGSAVAEWQNHETSTAPDDARAQVTAAWELADEWERKGGVMDRAPAAAALRRALTTTKEDK